MRCFVCAAVTTLLLIPADSIFGQSDMYFPPAQGSPWETLSPDSLGWCSDKIESLVNFVEDTDGRAFIILKDGRIVIEEYMNGFTADSVWYWASAAKTITAALVGIAQEEGHLDIHSPVSAYLGTGWADCNAEEELWRTVFHQLTMSSGFNPAPWFWDCTEPECFQCFETPGDTWHYHNGVYRKLIEVVEEAASTTRNIYTTQKIKNKIGMEGFWFDNLFISRARDMARFGLLALNDFVWDGDSVLTDTAYVSAMRNTALQANRAYGYLWWLNGKSSYFLPFDTSPVQGSLIPSAPADLYAGMGANDQRLYVVPSEGMVVVRMGDAASEESPALSAYDAALWEYISDLPCEALHTAHTESVRDELAVFPNPSAGEVGLRYPGRYAGVRILSLSGAAIWQGPARDLRRGVKLPAGFYVAEATTLNGDRHTAKIVVQ